MMEATRFGDDFTLEFISAQLMGFRIPKEPFEPNGQWQLDYGVYSFTSQTRGPAPGGLVGSMTLARKPLQEGEAELTLKYKKTGPGAVQNVAGKIRCKTDLLATPVQWEYSVEVVDAEGKPYPTSRIAKRAEASEGRVDVVDDHGTRRLAINGPLAINWALWDAVMRMPRQKAEPIRFTMLDHFDQIKHRQTIAFCKSSVVTLGQSRVQEQSRQKLEKGRIRQARWATTGGEEVTLHGFEQLGEGIVPWVYWTDEQGRLLFVVAGLEVYILNSWQK